MWSENCQPLTLQKRLSTDLPLIEKVNMLLTLAHFYVFDQQSDPFIQQLDSILKDHPECIGQQAHLMYLKGCKRQMVGDWAGSTEKLESAIDIYRKLEDVRGEVEAMIGVAVVRAMNTQHNEGILLLEQAREQIEVHGLPAICRAYMLNQLAVTHLMVELYDLAESYGRQAYDCALNLAVQNEGVLSKNVMRVQTASTWTLSYALALLGRYDESVQLAEQTLRFVRPLNVPYWEARLVQIIGYALIESDHLDNAIEKLMGFVGSIVSDPLPMYNDCYALLGIAHARNGQHEEAEPLLLTAIKPYDGRTNLGLIYLNCLKSLSNIAKSQGRYEEAFSYLEQSEKVWRVYKQRKSELKLAHLTEVHQYEIKKKEADMLRTSNEKLQRAYDEQSELVKLVAHDIYNPLSSIVLRAQLAEKFARKEQTDKTIESINAIRQSAGYIREIVAQLQFVDLLDQGELKLDWQIVSIRKVIMAAIKRNQPAATLKQIEIVCEGDMSTPIRVGELAIMQMLDNVLSNAIKYSHPNSVVRIGAKRVDDVVEINCVDEGVGIDPAEAHRLFSKFGRLNSSRPTSDERSTGLGLYIVQKLVHEMEGEITVSSDGLGTGTTFTIQLPVSLPTITAQSMYLKQRQLNSEG